MENERKKIQRDMTEIICKEAGLWFQIEAVVKNSVNNGLFMSLFDFGTM